MKWPRLCSLDPLLLAVPVGGLEPSALGGQRRQSIPCGCTGDGGTGVGSCSEMAQQSEALRLQFSSDTFRKDLRCWDAFPGFRPQSLINSAPYGPVCFKPRSSWDSHDKLETHSTVSSLFINFQQQLLQSQLQISGCLSTLKADLSNVKFTCGSLTLRRATSPPPRTPESNNHKYSVWSPQIQGVTKPSPRSNIAAGKSAFPESQIDLNFKCWMAQ